MQRSSVLDKILKYRLELMGIATIWIMFYHSGLNTGSVFSIIKNLGYGGVDLFVFLSGMGVFFSLKSNDLQVYCVNRLKRIFPGYIPVVIAYMLLLQRDFIAPSEIIGNISGVGFIFGLKNQVFWYCSLILLLYMIAPYICCFLTDNTRYMFLKSIVTVILTIVISFMWLGQDGMIAASRIPVFVLGIIVAAWRSNRNAEPSDTTNNKMHSTSIFMVTAVVFLIQGVGLIWLSKSVLTVDLWKSGLFWYPFFFIAPALCIIIACMLDKCFGAFRKNKVIEHRNIFSIIGKSSWEIYLIHAPVFGYIKSKCVLSNLEWIILTIVCILAGVLWRFLMCDVAGRCSVKR